MTFCFWTRMKKGILTVYPKKEKNMFNKRLLMITTLMMSLGLACSQQDVKDDDLSWLKASKTGIQDKLIKRFGEEQKDRIV